MIRYKVRHDINWFYDGSVFHEFNVLFKSKGKENLSRHTENGRLVLVTEQRPLNNSSERSGEIVLKGSAEKLIERLMFDDSYSLVDPTYIQDFLLTYRVFIDEPIYVANKLVEWFQFSSKLYLGSPSNSPSNAKKKVYRILLEWITNHFNDFETNKELYEFVERFQEVLGREKMYEQLRVLTIAISTKSKTRTVILARSKRDETLMFSIQGGWEKGYGIFVSKVDRDPKGSELGIRKGDQILEVNGHSFQHISLVNALDTLKSFTHLSISLKYNPIGFNEMLLHPEKSPHRNKKNMNSNQAYLIEYLQKQQNQFQQNQTTNSESKNGHSTSPNSLINQLQTNNQLKKTIGSIPPLPPSSNGQTPRNKSKEASKNPFKSTGSNLNLTSAKAFLGRFNRKAHSKELESLQQLDSSAPALKSITRSPSPSLSALASTSTYGRSTVTTFISELPNNGFPRNSSTNSLNTNSDVNGNDSISNTSSLHNIGLHDPEQFVGKHVLKIFKSDQTFKYLVVHKVSVKSLIKSWKKNYFVFFERKRAQKKW